MLGEKMCDSLDENEKDRAEKIKMECKKSAEKCEESAWGVRGIGLDG